MKDFPYTFKNNGEGFFIHLDPLAPDPDRDESLGKWNDSSPHQRPFWEGERRQDGKPFTQ
jgi:hypothetical protein